MGSHSDAEALRAIVAESAEEVKHHYLLFQKALAKRASAQRELDSLVYPILKLPPEITSEIFVRCLPTSYTDRERNTTNPHEAPMLLAHVCMEWRRIAFSTPALWTTIDIDVRDSKRARALKAWIGRARTLPLSVKLKIGPNLNKKAVDVIFATMVSQSPTLRTLDLDICVTHLEAMDASDDHWSFPQLQVLNLRLSDGHLYDLEEEVPFVETFSNSPLLREVLLNWTTPSYLCFPWHHLTKFTGTLPTVADFVEVLRLGPNLTECTFALAEEDLEPEITVIFTHPNLRFLTLAEGTGEMGDPIQSSHLLAYLSLPALQTLHIVDHGDEFSEDILDEFLERSSPPLRELTLRLASTDIGITLFLRVPDLNDLQIWNPSSSFITVFFDFFNDHDDSFLSQLQHLAFLGCQSPPPAYTMLGLACTGLTDRWGARNSTEFAELKSFRLVWARDLGRFVEDVLLPFRKLVAEGMNITIQGKTHSYL